MKVNASPFAFFQFGDADTQEDRIVLGHPKLEKLRDMVLEHFRSKEGGEETTRVMIFSQYRDSVQEITACLHGYRPLVKVMEFVGQAGTKGQSVSNLNLGNFTTMWGDSSFAMFC